MQLQPACFQRQGESSFSTSVSFLSTIPIVLLVILSVAFGGEEIKKDEITISDGPAALREKWGIEIVRLKMTASGHIVDLRYRVLDPAKSFPFFDSNIKPTLVDERTGSNLSVYTAPRIGGMRQKARKPEAGRIYFILFGNQGIVQDGSKVAFVIGDVKVENLTIEGETQLPGQ